MTIAVTDFVKNFPAFNDDRIFPVDMIQFNLDFSYANLNADRFADQIDMAAQLFTAHNIILERRAFEESQKKITPGFATGMINSKSVGEVSTGYDTSAIREEGYNDLNLTIYGIRLIRMMKIAGMGPLLIGVGVTPLFVSGSAWMGPPSWPGWFG